MDIKRVGLVPSSVCCVGAFCFSGDACIAHVLIARAPTKRPLLSQPWNPATSLWIESVDMFVTIVFVVFVFELRQLTQSLQSVDQRVGQKRAPKRGPKRGPKVWTKRVDQKPGTERWTQSVPHMGLKWDRNGIQMLTILNTLCVFDVLCFRRNVRV